MEKDFFVSGVATEYFTFYSLECHKTQSVLRKSQSTHSVFERMNPSFLLIDATEPHTVEGRTPGNHQRWWCRTFLTRPTFVCVIAAACLASLVLPVISPRRAQIEHQMDWNETEGWESILPSPKIVSYDDSKSWQHRGLQGTEKWSTLSYLGNHLGRNNNKHNVPTARKERRTISQERQQQQQKGVYTAAQADQSVATVLRVNCGGGAYTDEGGKQWSEDAYFTNGSSHSEWLMSWLKGLPDWLVFQTYRAENGLFLWLFPTSV